MPLHGDWTSRRQIRLRRGQRLAMRNTTNFNLLGLYILASQFFRQQFAFYDHDLFMQLVLKALKVWRGRFPLCSPFQDKLAQLLNGRASQNRIRMAKFHRNLRVGWNLWIDPYFAWRFPLCQVLSA